jgi:hypothetical protein
MQLTGRTQQTYSTSNKRPLNYVPYIRIFRSSCGSANLQFDSTPVGGAVSCGHIVQMEAGRTRR